jgi:hypothetical protein
MISIKSHLSTITPIYSIITLIWFVLLGLSGVIAVLIAPIAPNGTYLVILAIGIVKLAIGTTLIVFWLASWYKIMQLLLVYELQKNPKIDSSKINM